MERELIEALRDCQSIASGLAYEVGWLLTYHVELESLDEAQIASGRDSLLAWARFSGSLTNVLNALEGSL